MNWKNLKIGKKLYIGFGLVLALAIAIGLVGWNGLTTVGQKVECADDANRLIKESLNGRLCEKNYQLRTDKIYIEQAEKIANEFKNQAEKLSAKLKDNVDKEAVSVVETNNQKWFTALNQYANLEDQKHEADAVMVQYSRNAIAEIEKMRVDQKAKLEEELDRSRANQVILDRLAKADNANRLVKFMLEARRQEKNYIIRKDQQYVENVDQKVKEIITLAEEMKASFKDPVNIKQANTVLEAVKMYKKSFDDYVEFVNSQTIENDKMVVEARELIAGCDDLRAGQKEEMESASSSAITLAISFVIGALIIGILVAFIITRGIVNPINKTVEMLKDVAQGEGDLTKRIEIEQKDEVGDLAKWFNTFMDKLHDIIATVAGNTEQLASAATEISSSSEELSAGVKEQTNQTAQVSTAVEEMTATIVETSKNTGEASQKAQEAATKAQEGSQLAEDTSRGMDEIVDSSNITGQNIEGLAEKATAIGEIITVIDDVADQTNLLALNAAIEAARAGEQGRGFAVVADEVRKLAERTTKATKEVAETIKGIQSDVSNANEQIGDSSKIVEKGKDLVQKTNTSLNEIYSGIEAVQEMMRQVATASEEQSAAAEQISRSVENVDRITKETATGAEQAATASEQLSRQSEELKSLVGGFKLRKNAKVEG